MIVKSKENWIVRMRMAFGIQCNSMQSMLMGSRQKKKDWHTLSREFSNDGNDSGDDSSENSEQR